MKVLVYAADLVMLVSRMLHWERCVCVNYKMRARHKSTKKGADAIYPYDKEISPSTAKWTKTLSFNVR